VAWAGPLSALLALATVTTLPAAEPDEQEAPDDAVHAEHAEGMEGSHGSDDAHGHGEDDHGNHEEDHGDGHGGHGSRIPKDAGRGYDPDDIPDRPERLTLFGDPFLSTGNLEQGFEVPGGAVWRPRLHFFGTYRTAVQAFNNGDTTFSEWANRLDLFGNLQLTGTERVVAGFQFLHDRDEGEFTGYNFHPEQDPLSRGDEGFVDTAFNADLRTLFFEGEIGELVPDLRGSRSEDFAPLDLGFAVGRQPLVKQDGLLVNDTVDAIGLTANSLRVPGGSNLQITGMYGWNEIHRNNNVEFDDQHLFGFFAETDLPKNTIEGDLIYVLDDQTGNDSLHWGTGSIQRMGHFNTTFRALGSHAVHDENAAVGDGILLFGEASWTPPYTHDNMYVTAFWSIDEFTSAARGPLAGGPLGQAGINFAAIGLGRYGAPISNRTSEAAGGAVGYRWLVGNNERTHFTAELGGRHSTEPGGDDSMSLSGRYQQAIGQHTILQLDLFGSLQESRDPGFGGRIELRYTF
jgi:hypothetical protein